MTQGFRPLLFTAQVSTLEFQRLERSIYHKAVILAMSSEVLMVQEDPEILERRDCSLS